MTKHGDPSVRKTHWPRSLQRLKSRPRTGKSRKISRRALLVAFGAIVALVGSAFVIGSELGWWSEETGRQAIVFPKQLPRNIYSKRRWSPEERPAGDVGIVATGNWDGQNWYIAAYRSVGNQTDKNGQVCYAIAGGTPPSSSELNSGHPVIVANCFSIRELHPELAWSTEALLMPIDYLGGPSYVVGPVVDEAVRVCIELNRGTPIETKTVAAPTATGIPMRFFFSELPRDTIVTRVEAHNAKDTRVGQVITQAPDGEISDSTRCD